MDFSQFNYGFWRSLFRFTFKLGRLRFVFFGKFACIFYFEGKGEKGYTKTLSLNRFLKLKQSRDLRHSI